MSYGGGYSNGRGGGGGGGGYNGYGGHSSRDNYSSGYSRYNNLGLDIVVKSYAFLLPPFWLPWG